MNSSSAKVLQIPRTIRGSNSKMLQNAVQMAVSSSKMLQIATETDRTGDPMRDPKTEKKIFPKRFRTLLEYDVSIQHRPQFEPAWTHLTPTWAKVGSNTALFGQTLDDRVQCRVFLGMVLRTCRTPRTHCTTVPLTVPSGRATLSYLDF